LYCTNRDVEKENDARLAKLEGEVHRFPSQDSFYSRINAAVPADEKKRLKDLLSKKVPTDLGLKVNAQVILLKKLKEGLVNGSRGIVTDVQGSTTATVRFDTGEVKRVERETFQQMGATATLYRKQLPLRLGWALTIHKSQGMTLSRAEVQLDDAFSYGQAYVALSRLTSFDGLWIGGRGISQHNIKAHPSALAFYGLA
jgi:ATP-dependent exoDNAse (exonuclease V) alpha subunit